MKAAGELSEDRLGPSMVCSVPARKSVSLTALTSTFALPHALLGHVVTDAVPLDWRFWSITHPGRAIDGHGMVPVDI
jgi:hypothetical protein